MAKMTNRLSVQSDGARGFTLVEVMIALVVLAVGLLALVQLQVATINGLAYSRHFSVATQLAEGEMERLMSYPFPEQEANNLSYYPQDKNGNNIQAQLTDGTRVSPFHDPVGASGAGDGQATRVWALTPINEQGQPARRGEQAYVVTWTVERGGSEGTPALSGKAYGFPGKYQVNLVVSVLWFDKGDKKNAWDPITSFVDSADRLAWSKRATISSVRELQAQER